MRLQRGGIRFLVIAGGEPLSRPGIEDILAFIHTRGFEDVTLLTNGTLLSVSLATIVARTVNNVHVSLDGPNEEINAVIRGRGHFEEIIEGVKLLKVAGVKLIRLVTTLFSVNIHSMREMRALRDELGVQLGTSIFAEVGRGGNFSYLTPQDKDVIKFFKEELISVNCDSTVSDKKILSLHAGITCGSGTLMISVDCHGDIFPCHLFHRPELKIGNLLEEEDFEKIMKESPVAKEFRARNVEKRKCHGCSVEYFCKGGCLAHTVAAHERNQAAWTEKDPFCRVHEEVIGNQIWGTSHDQK